MWVFLALAAGVLQSTRNIVGEREVVRQIPGMAMISAGILLVLLGGASR